MARGWESKSVEDQQAEAEARKHAAGRSQAPKTDADRAREARRLSLSVARSRVLQDLQAACHPNHRATLEQSLAFLDREIAALEAPAS
jgi:hypothetical protein